MTTIVYNGCTLSGIVTKRFQQEAVYDDTGTDLLFYRFTIRATGYVHGMSDAPGIYTRPPNNDYSNAAQNHISVRSRLMEPRKEFTMAVAGNVSQSASPLTPAAAVTDYTLLHCNGAASAVSGSSVNLRDFDVCNGPKPRVYDVVRITGANIFKVDFEIEICKVECEGSTAVGNASGVLNNRWTMADEIDNNQMTTRTLQGRLRSASSRINPHSFRHWVVPPLQPGFRRDRMAFVATADGLNLDYTVVDKEIAYSAPYPATSWRYSHTETLGDRMITQGSVSVELSTHRKGSKRELMMVGLAIVDNVLWGARLDADNTCVTDSLSITDSYGDNENSVAIQATVTRTALDNEEKAISKGGNIIAEQLGKPLDSLVFANTAAQGYDSTQSILPGPDGVSGQLPVASAFACYLQSPCDSVHGFMDQQFGAFPNPSLSGLLANVTLAVVDTLSTLADELLTDEHKQAMYTFFQNEAKYFTKENVVNLPVAKVTGRVSGGTTGGGGFTYPYANDDAFDGTRQTEEDTTKPIALGPPTTEYVVRVRGERVGKPPEMPRAKNFTDDNGIKYRLKESTKQIISVSASPDGSIIYKEDSEHRWHTSRAPSKEEKQNRWSIPWLLIPITPFVGDSLF